MKIFLLSYKCVTLQTALHIVIKQRFLKLIYLNTVLSGPLSDADDFFIVADGYLRNIYQVDASSGATRQLLPFGTASYPVAVAYDSTAKLLYWTDNSAYNTINRYSLRTSRSTVIYRDTSIVGKEN